MLHFTPQIFMIKIRYSKLPSSFTVIRITSQYLELPTKSTKYITKCISALVVTHIMWISMYFKYDINRVEPQLSEPLGTTDGL